jgi:hypothetical protein
LLEECDILDGKLLIKVNLEGYLSSDRKVLGSFGIHWFGDRLT